MKTYTITQEQMDRLHGAAHSGALLGGNAAYDGCLKIGAILSEIAFKEGFDKSPGIAEEPPYPFCRTPEKCAGKGYCPAVFACND